MARWSLFEKRDVESLSRVLTARTMDGYKIRAKLAVNFTRLLSEAESEALAEAYIGVFRALIEVEICEGRLPFDDVSLHRLLTERVQEVPGHRVRVNGAHIVPAGSASSTSMPAVTMPVPSSTHSMPVPSSARSMPVPSSARSMPVPSSMPIPSRGRSVAVPSGGQSMPPLRHPSELPRSLAPESRAPGAFGSVPVRRTVSGFVHRNADSAWQESSFTRATPGVQSANSLPALGAELGRAVRGSAAALLLTAMRENQPQLIDPLALFEGKLDRATQRGLVQEACIAVAYVLHRALVGAGISEKHATALVQAAAEASLPDGQLPVAEISRYFATDMPAEEFHKAFCRHMGILGTDAAELALVSLMDQHSRAAAACAQTLQATLRRVG